MTIVNNFDNLLTPDVLVREIAPPPSVAASAIGTIGVVCQAIRGPVGVPTVVTSVSDFIAKFGEYNSAQFNEGFMFVYNLFKAGASRLKVVRVTDGNEVRATLVNGSSTYRLVTPGSYGNSVTMTVTANAATGYVDLVFKYGNETYTYRGVTFTNASDPNYIDTVLTASGDGFVEMTVIASTNPTAGTYTFTGGSNGTLQGLALLDSAYTGTNGANGLTGLVAFEGDDEVEIIVASRANATVSLAVRDHCNLVSVTPRMGVVATVSGTTVAGMTSLMLNNFNTDRVVMTYPWLQIVNPYTNKKEYHAPHSFYAGLLSTLSYHESPCRQAINGPIGTERVLTRGDVDTLTANRVSPITLLNSVFVPRNGNNTSADAAKNSITRRRAVNFFAKTFENGAQQFVGRPHTPDLRNQIKSAFGALLQTEVGLGKIGQVNGSKPYAVKCDNQNNTNTTVQQGKLVVDIAISLWAAADYILISLDAAEAKVITIQ